MTSKYIDYTHNPFPDMMGQNVVEGDCLAYPEVVNKKTVRQNIMVCEGYDDKGVVLRYLNRRTGRWVRFFPRQNSNIIKVQLGDKSIEEASKDVYPWVNDVRTRDEVQQGHPKLILKKDVVK